MSTPLSMPVVIRGEGGMKKLSKQPQVANPLSPLETSPSTKQLRAENAKKEQARKVAEAQRQLEEERAEREPKGSQYLEEVYQREASLYEEKGARRRTKEREYSECIAGKTGGGT
jgi:hypothetical protein